MLASDWLKESKELEDEFVSYRRAFHMDPELGRNEFRTQARIEKYLNDFGIETEKIADTGLVGVIRGSHDGPTVALRSDIDALPVTEATGYTYASRNEGVMHACGHDVHMSSLVGAAKLLAAHRDEIHGTVKLFFQPDEEGDGGAKRMIEAGCLEGVSAVFGGHVSPEIPLGTYGIKYGKFFAAANGFVIHVHGKTAHGATPEKGIDALNAAIDIYKGLNEIPALFAEKGEKCVLLVGKLEGGTAQNIVPDLVRMEGVVRVLGVDSMKQIKDMMIKIAYMVSAATGTTCEIQFGTGYPGVVNTDPETECVHNSAKDMFGEENVTVIENPRMTTEDFGYFINASSGAFIDVGVGGTAALHNDHFLPSDDVVAPTAALYAYNAVRYLSLHAQNEE